MATLTVEGVPPALIERIAEEAAARGRCLNSEVIVLLARSLQERFTAGPGRPTMETGNCGVSWAGSPGERRCVGWGGDEAATSRTGGG